MQILSIKNTRNNNQFNAIQHPQFKGIIATKPSNVGKLGRETSLMIQDFIHRYDEIKKVLERKTEEGLKKIAMYYPEISIGETLVFHNCGDDKSSRK